MTRKRGLKKKEWRPVMLYLDKEHSQMLDELVAGEGRNISDTVRFALRCTWTARNQNRDARA